SCPPGTPASAAGRCSPATRPPSRSSSHFPGRRGAQQLRAGYRDATPTVQTHGQLAVVAELVVPTPTLGGAVAGVPAPPGGTCPTPVRLVVSGCLGLPCLAGRPASRAL